MFESVGRMFWPNKSGDATSSPKRSRYKEDMHNDESNENLHELKVNDSHLILQRILQLHSEQLMTDVTLVIDGKEFPAHRLILSSSSDVFQVMLMNPEWSECKESRILLQEPQQCIDVFHLFLAYFYSGQIVLKYDMVMPILALADKYNVKNLASKCISYMCTNIAQAAAHKHLISWLQYTLACGHTDVSTNCQNFVKWNFEFIVQTEDYGNFEAEVFISLLQQNDLVVENEMTLYNCAVKWLNRQRDQCTLEGDSETDMECHMKSLTEQIMINIRFPMMTPVQLAKLLLSPLINKYKEFFVERMAIGMIYHSGQEDRVLDIYSTDNGRLLFTPRLYTSDNFSSALVIDNFNSLPSYETRGFIFSTHTNLAEYKGEYVCDWMVDLYPKGVWFKKFYLIVWQGTVEVPEYVLPTVRLAVTCKDLEAHRVRIGILIYGERGGIEYIVTVVERIHTFSGDEKLLNIENLIPFEEINPRVAEYSKEALHLIGSTRNTLKMHIIITPLSEFCSNISPSFILN